MNESATDVQRVPVKRTIQRASAQMRRLVEIREQWPSEERRFPFVTQQGVWTWEDKWSNGFLIGALWRLYQLEGDSFWKEQADRLIGSLHAYKDQGEFQDIGFLMYYSYALGYDVTGNEEYRKIALEAADHLFASLMPGGYLMCNWLPEGESYAGVDGMMNLSLWLWAHRVTGEERYMKAVTACVQTTLKTMVREDGGTYEYVRLDRESGAFLQALNKNAADPARTVWTRGHVWAIYGLVQTCLHRQGIVDLSELDRLIDFYMTHTTSSLVPTWDLLVDDPDAILDASAGSAVCSALLQAAEGLREIDAERAGRYEELGTRLLMALTSEDHIPKDPTHQGILLHASSPLRFVAVANESQIWGDYFLLEALSFCKHM